MIYDRHIPVISYHSLKEAFLDFCAVPQLSTVVLMPSTRVYPDGAELTHPPCETTHVKQICNVMH
jgi:hypothetical protein